MKHEAREVRDMADKREKLVAARKRLGLTQEQVAQAVGIDRTAYTRIECGYRKPPVDLAIKIAAVLEGEVEDIFLNENVHQKHTQSDQASA